MKLAVAEQTRQYRERADEVARGIVDELVLPPASRRALVALIGLPGAGKSHFARLLAERLDGVVVASDQLRRRLFVAPSYAAGETRTVFAVAHAVARRLLGEGRTVIVDATNLREQDRRPLHALARECAAPLVLVRVVAPEETIAARLALRRSGANALDASDADERIHAMMRVRYQEPRVPYVLVDSTADLDAAAARVAGALDAACA